MSVHQEALFCCRETFSTCAHVYYCMTRGLYDSVGEIFAQTSK